jgi:hypothetical protein
MYRLPRTLLRPNLEHGKEILQDGTYREAIGSERLGQRRDDMPRQKNKIKDE